MPIDFIKKNLVYNSELAPEAWRGSKLKPEVRYKLLQAAKMFINYIDIPNFKISDVILTGSMANFNYNKLSDFDVHLVTRYADLQCDDIAEAFYQAKKKIWNDNHDIIVRGHEVELYVEDINEPTINGGIFSLLNNSWIKKPTYELPSYDDKAVNHKTQDLIYVIKKTIQNSTNDEELRRLMDKIRRMRRSGLESNGEYSVENLSFKILRNLGYLDQLSKSIKDKQDAELSLQ